MGQTMVEKLFSKKNKLGTPVMAGDIVEARIDGMMHNYSFHTVIEQAITRHVSRGINPVALGCRDRILANRKGQVVGQRFGERRGIQSDMCALSGDLLCMLGHGALP